MKNITDRIRISGIVEESIVDGPGIRYVIFSQGCIHNCPGCHNPETHSLEKGLLMNINDIYKNIIKNPLLKGVTFSGGEPFLQSTPFYNLAVLLKKKGLDVITYTGFTFEELRSSTDTNVSNLLKITDFLIDGKFEIEKKTALIPFLGSTNQRIIDVKKSYQENKIIKTIY